MKRFAEAGVDRLLCLQHFGGISHEDSLRSTRLIGEELIDDFR